MITTKTWTVAFETVCQRGTEALQWGLPEPWIHAELFAELKHRAPTTSFHSGLLRLGLGRDTGVAVRTLRCSFRQTEAVALARQ